MVRKELLKYYMASWQAWMKGVLCSVAATPTAPAACGSCWPYRPQSPSVLLHGGKKKHTHKNLHFQRICLSAIFSKHLIFYQANCTHLLARSRDTVMTCKAPLWVLSCLRESSRGTEPLRFILPWPKLLATSCFYLAGEPPGTLLFGLDSCSPLAIAQELSSASRRS